MEGEAEVSEGVFFRIGAHDEAAELVKRWHYSKRPPANVQCVGTWHQNGGLFGDYGPAIAACFFSIPPTRWSETVLELSRLVRAEGVALPPLTGLISLMVRHIAQKKLGDLLVSFADKTAHHHGGIYQASSWNYHGARERRMDGVIIAGKFHAGRSCNSVWGTQSPRLLSEKLGVEVLPHFDDGKHLYWRALNKEGRKKALRLKLENIAYPKPQKVAA
jgi:hypothetical protein